MNVNYIEEIDENSYPIYYSKEYNSIFANYDKTTHKLLKIEINNKYIYLPLLMNEIEHNIFEAYSPYGYSGFYSNEDIDETEFKTNWNNVIQFLKDNNIISLFLRNSPFLQTQRLLMEKHNYFNRTTYLTKLKQNLNIDKFLLDKKTSLRRSIKYGIKNEVEVYFTNYLNIKEQEIDEFYEIYVKSMRKKNTWAYYFFNKDFFKQHIFGLKEKCEIAFAVDKYTNKKIAVAMFLLDEFKDIVHYHFGAFDDNFKSFRPMYFLFAKSIIRYGNKQKRYLHLGGGLCIDESDGLSRFKKSFADEKLSYYVSKIVVDEIKYNNLRTKFNLDNSNIFLMKDAISMQSDILK